LSLGFLFKAIVTSIHLYSGSKPLKQPCFRSSRWAIFALFALLC